MNMVGFLNIGLVQEFEELRWSKRLNLLLSLFGFHLLLYHYAFDEIVESSLSGTKMMNESI